MFKFFKKLFEVEKLPETREEVWRLISKNGDSYISATFAHLLTAIENLEKK